jgi:hypothetical protein
VGAGVLTIGGTVVVIGVSANVVVGGAGVAVTTDDCMVVVEGIIVGELLKVGVSDVFKFVVLELVTLIG